MRRACRPSRGDTRWSFRRATAAFFWSSATAAPAPSYGLFALGEMDDGFEHASWEGGSFVGELAQPFPHDGAWNLPESFWEQVGEEEDSDEGYERHLARMEQHYWAPHLMNGAIPICHEGCAYRHWLVLTGSQRDTVWLDRRADDGGVEPVRTGARERTSFAGWYLHWLIEGLGKFRRRKGVAAIVEALEPHIRV